MHKQQGQITIFIALLFQVLFVFFAMLINVGMTVHDKINLQNSVDIAAYYGAQKQAEILNAIAHINYQMHQDWKLLAWRLRGLGDSNRAGHPINPINGYSIIKPDQEWFAAKDASLCMTTGSWSYPGIDSNENVCEKGNAINIPQIPEINIPAFFPWDLAVKELVKDLRKQAGSSCQGMGLYNWTLAVSFMAAYRLQVGIRQTMIEKLATNLQELKDIEGNSIETGMLNTFRANLTRANLESLDAGSGSFQVYNSMQGLQSAQWLPNVKIWPLVFYTDLYSTTDSSCRGEPKRIQLLPRRSEAIDNFGKFDSLIYEPKQENAEYHSTRGREKNPWYMVYIGAKVETSPRKPFFPFGTPVRLVARAFAKPFGGRVGPWSKEHWTRDSGWAQTGKDIDPLKPPRYVDDEAYQMSQANIPNFSRFPGDKIGLKSGSTLSLVGTDMPADTPQKSVLSYSHLPEMAATNPLAYDEKKPNLALRQFEIAAIAPDVFDITYFSIQPDFHAVFGPKLEKIVSSPEEIPMDLGSLPNEPFSVRKQIETITLGQGFRGFKQAFFKVSDWQHLLTNWAPNATMDFSFPSQRFGICQLEPKQGAPPTDSSCIAGGRSGYSVKIVSRAYLTSLEHAVGGNLEDRGPILNPPPEEF